MSTYPDVFEQNVGQKASIVECYQVGGASDGEIGEPLRKCTEETAASWPVNAIDIITNLVEIKKKEIKKIWNKYSLWKTIVCVC